MSTPTKIKHEPEIGKLITGEAFRDAIHIAVVPLKAFRSLNPGEHVGLTENGEADNLSESLVGIVDPYLPNRVPRGGMFYLFLYPKSITSLRHEWTHPAFDDVKLASAPVPELSEKEKSEAWLQDIADRCGVDYHRMIGAAEEDDYIHMGENEGYKNVLDGQYEDFKRHLEIVLGKPPANSYPFSCSC